MPRKLSFRVRGVPLNNVNYSMECQGQFKDFNVTDIPITVQTREFQEAGQTSLPGVKVLSEIPRIQK